MRSTFVIIAWLAFGLGGDRAWGQRDWSNVVIKTTHVAGKVYMLEGSGGNIGVLIGPDGNVLVDAQFAELSEKIKAAVEKLSPGKTLFLFNTHYHYDHTDGNTEFGRASTIISHTNVRKRLATTQTILGTVHDPHPKHGLPAITFDESLSIHVNGEDIQAVHYPGGHTDGDSVIFFTSSNVIHMGDLMFNLEFPFVDIQHGGDVEEYLSSIEAVIARAAADAKVIPGHGPLTDLAGLKTYRRMLAETIDVVRRGMAAGKRAGELQAAGLPDEWRSWGEGWVNTDEWIRTIYRCLRR